MTSDSASGDSAQRDFDPADKERLLRAESESWDTSSPQPAEPGDIPIIDVSSYLSAGSAESLSEVAAKLREACETVGFWQMVGHDMPAGLIDSTFDAVRSFHALPLETKRMIQMDRPEHPLGGVGYLPVKNRKLPARATGNLNEAFLAKRGRDVSLDDNQWLAEADAPGFREAVETYAAAVESLALRILPIYAAALGMEADHFAPGFTDPFWRLRMTHYPPDDAVRESNDEFGIAPHVDTTFFTLLLQDGPGLTIYSHVRECWIKAPVVENAFVVNSGELLKQWTNDRFLSVRHFVNRENGVQGSASRYSIPFFFNANSDYPMEPIPTCVTADRPAKYPTISYDQSQAVAQGE